MNSLKDLEILWNKDVRLGLSKTITLIESTRADHRDIALSFISKNFDKTGNSIRIGISGPPGVGKSTLLNRLGKHFVEAGRRVAVLAVDPTSPTSGGSILGDKTRMSDLSASGHTFIRPTPSGHESGGIAVSTKNSQLLCEIAGYDVVFIETVGVGQAEYNVRELVDVFVLLHQPSSGDSLQSAKKGILDLADLVVVTKHDGELKSAAEIAKAELEEAFHYGISDTPRQVSVFLTGIDDHKSIENIANQISKTYKQSQESGSLKALREKQLRHWLECELFQRAKSKIVKQLDALTDSEIAKMGLKNSKLQSNMNEAALEIEKKIFP